MDLPMEEAPAAVAAATTIPPAPQEEAQAEDLPMEEAPAAVVAITTTPLPQEEGPSEASHDIFSCFQLSRTGPQVENQRSMTAEAETWAGQGAVRYPLPSSLPPHFRMANPLARRNCVRPDGQYSQEGWDMTWLPYISTDGKVWWFNERCSLFCWDDDKADIYYSAMEINEPRYMWLSCSRRQPSWAWAKLD